MDFDITEGLVDIADHRQPPEEKAKDKIIKRLRADAKKLQTGSNIKRTLKYIDNAGRLDIAIYYGVERVSPTHPEHYYQINCERSQIIEAVEAFIEKELTTDKHNAAIANKLSLFQSRTSGALEKAREAKLPSAIS
jgi:hypothetical protein